MTPKQALDGMTKSLAKIRHHLEKLPEVHRQNGVVQALYGYADQMEDLTHALRQKKLNKDELLAKLEEATQQTEHIFSLVKKYA